MPEGMPTRAGRSYVRGATRLVAKLGRIGQTGTPMEMFCNLDTYWGRPLRRRHVLWACTGAGNPMTVRDWQIYEESKNDAFTQWKTPEELRTGAGFRWIREYS